jgi:hypothetical protein
VQQIVTVGVQAMEEKESRLSLMHEFESSSASCEKSSGPASTRPKVGRTEVAKGPGLINTSRKLAEMVSEVKSWE